MRQTCDCGAVVIVAYSERATISCPKCGWHYTYTAVPQRITRAIEWLVQWLKKRAERWDDNDEETGS